MQAAQVHRGQRQHPLVVQAGAELSQRIERVHQVLQDVQHDDGVGAPGRVGEVLNRPLAQVHAEPFPAELDRPLRRLDSPRLPPGRAGHVEEQPHVRTDLQETPGAHRIARHGAQHPTEQLSAAALFSQVGLVHYF